MRTATLNVYKFNELSDEAKQTAIDNYLENWERDNWDWNDCIIQEKKRELETLGFSAIDIRFSLYSQSGGAMFKADIETKDLLRLFNIRDRFNLAKECIVVNCYRNNYRYCHNTAVTWDFFIDAFYVDILGEKATEFVNNVIDQLDKKFNAWYTDKCKEIHDEIQSEYEHLTSNAYVADWLRESETEFLENGEIYI